MNKIDRRTMLKRVAAAAAGTLLPRLATGETGATAPPPTSPPVGGAGAPVVLPRLHVEYCPVELTAGLAAIRAEFPHRFAVAAEPGARRIRFEPLPARTADSLVVEKHGADATVRYARKIDAFRALGRVLGETGARTQQAFRERVRFRTLGVTLDCSRNAVFLPAEMKSLLCRLALMGINTLAPYTEDTYVIPDEPFWGYLRGGYTYTELKELDDFASALGVEMFLAIQTLGHLGQVLHWPAYADVRDTKEIILAGGNATYVLLEKAIRAASAPFRSKRIHLGMDESGALGTGRYRKLFGKQPKFEIFTTHLRRVRDICTRLGLQPMIWGDMILKLSPKEEPSHGAPATVAPAVVASIPQGVQYLYWDYSHTDPAHYASVIDRYRRLGIKPAVVTGTQSWNRFWASLPFANRCTDAFVAAAKEERLDDAYISVWFDDGAECELFSVLPAVQRFAEHGYGDVIEPDLLRARFLGSTDARYDDWVGAAAIDELPGRWDYTRVWLSVAKPLLWEDPLLALFDPELGNVSLRAHYEFLADRLTHAAAATRNSGRLRQPALLSRALACKCDLRRNLAAAYARGDRARLRSLADGDVPRLQAALDELWHYHRAQWLATRKPFGWEVIEARYGALRARLDTVATRLRAYLDGRLSALPELAVKLREIGHGKPPGYHYLALETPSIIK